MRTFLFLTLLFLFSRLFFIFGFDLRTEPVNDLEKFQGMITYEWIKGPNLPIMDYRGSTWMAGAEKVIALWQIPFFLLLGPSLFALRLASVAWSLLIFLLIFFFVKRHFSIRQAVWASLFFIFAPPGLIFMSLTSIGYHFQSTLFVLAFLFLFYEHHFGSLKRNWAFFLEGLVLGIGIYFSLQVLIALLAFFIFSLILERRRFFHPSLLFFFFGLGLGYAPGLYEGFANSFEQFVVYDKPVYEYFWGIGLKEKIIFTVKRFILLLVRFIPRGLRFEQSGFLAPFLAWGWYLLAVFSLWMLFRKGTRPTQLVLFYAALTSLIFVLSDFGLHFYSYLSPLMVFLCILLGLGWGDPRPMGLRSWRWLRAAGLLVCLIGWIPYLMIPRMAQVFQERGFSYVCFLTGFSMIKKVFGISIQKVNLKPLIEAGHHSLDRRFLPGFEQLVGGVFCFETRGSDMERDAALIDEAEENISHRANLYHQLGYCIACDVKEKPDIKILLERIEKLPSGLREALAEGVGECVLGEKPSLKLEPPPAIYDHFFRGGGMAFGWLFEKEFGKGVERILEFPEALRPILFEGFGKGTYWWDGGRGEITKTLEAKVPAPYQSYFKRGFKLQEYGTRE